MPYMTSSGLPMRFVEQGGRVLEIYQQATGPGGHTITLRPVGLRGGSNTGSLSGWGGTLLAQVS